MPTVLEVVHAEVLAFVEEVKAQLADGVSFSDAKPLLHDLKTRCINVAQAIEAAGPDKKEAVLLGLETAFDLLIVPYDIPYVPEWAEKILEGSARASIRPIFGPTIDGVVSALKWIASTGLNFKVA